MSTYRITALAQSAVEARLSGLLGAEAYDATFPGMRVGAVTDRIAVIWTRTEVAAARIERDYCDLLTAVLREMLDRPIHGINVLPVHFPFHA